MWEVPHLGREVTRAWADSDLHPPSTRKRPIGKSIVTQGRCPLAVIGFGDANPAQIADYETGLVDLLKMVV